MTADTGPMPAFSDYCHAVGADLATTLEVPYFGLPDAKVTPASCRQFGADVAGATASAIDQGVGGGPS